MAERTPIQQAAATMLERPVWRGHSMETWLEQAFPCATLALEEDKQQRSEAARRHLAGSCNLPGLRYELGSGEFETAYRQLRENCETGKVEMGSATMEHLETLSDCRDMFLLLRDMRLRIQNDFLPVLQALRGGDPSHRTQMREWMEMLQTTSVMGVEAQDSIPEQYRFDHPAANHKQFAEDMRELVKCLYADNKQAFARKMDDDPLGFVERVHYENRIKDYWKSR